MIESDCSFFNICISYSTNFNEFSLIYIHQTHVEAIVYLKMIK